LRSFMYKTVQYIITNGNRTINTAFDMPRSNTRRSNSSTPHVINIINRGRTIECLFMFIN